MAKKSVVESVISTVSSVIKDFFLGTLKTELQNLVKEITASVESAAKRLGKLFAQYVILFFIGLIGFFFFLISLVLITVDYFKLTLGGGLFIWGILLLVVAFLFSQLLSKEA